MTKEEIIIVNLLGGVIEQGIRKEEYEVWQFPDWCIDVCPDGTLYLQYKKINLCKFNIYNGATWINEDIQEEKLDKAVDYFLKIVYPMLYFGLIRNKPNQKQEK